MRGYLPLIRKDSITHMHGLAVYVKEGLSVAQDLSPSANVFVFGDFNVYRKDWLTYFGGTDRTGELCFNFSVSNNLS